MLKWLLVSVLVSAVACVTATQSQPDISHLVREIESLRDRVEQLEQLCGRKVSSGGHIHAEGSGSAQAMGPHRVLLDTLTPLSGNISQSGTQFSEVIVDSGVALRDVADPSSVVEGSDYNMLFTNGGQLYFRSSSGELYDVLAKEEIGNVNTSAPFWFFDSSLKLWHTFEADTVAGGQYIDKASSLTTRDGTGSHSSASGIRGLGVYSSSSNFLLTGYTVPQDDRSVSFWIKLTAFTGSYQLMGVQGTGGDHFYIGLNSQNTKELFTYVGNQGGSIEGYALTTNRWYHMGLTMGQNVGNIYLDGEIIATFNYADVTAVYEYAIGGLQNGNHLQEAVIDELKLWDRVVSPIEMREVYDYEKQSDVKESAGQTQPWVNDPTLRVWHTFDADTIAGAQYRDLATGLVTSDIVGSHSSTTGFIGEALRSPESNILDIEYYNPTNVKTVTFWVKHHSFQGSFSLMGSQEGGAHFYVGANSARQLYSFGGNAGGTVAGVTFTQDVWYWVAMKMSGSVVKVFVDGVEASSQTYSTPSGRYKYAIGGLQNQNHPMDISVDEFKYWTRALSDSELLDIYQYELGVGSS